MSFWFDPMVQTVGMPNNPGAGAYIGSPAQTSNYFNNTNATLAAANAYNPWANSGGGFGVQPAAYAATGAAYGRATGGFGGYGAANADPFTPVQSPEEAASSAAFNYGRGAQPFNAYGGGANPGGFSPSPNYTGGTGIWNQGAPAFNPYGGGANPGGFSPSPNYPGSFTPEQSAEYTRVNPDVAAAGVDPYTHARTRAAMEGRGGLPEGWGAGAQPFNAYGGGANPGGFSPSPNYTGGNQSFMDLWSGRAGGQTYGAAPPPQGGGGGQSAGWGGFDSGAYLKLNPDVAAAGVDPLTHAMTRGAMEGRQGLPEGTSSYFNPGTYAGDQGNYGIPYNGQPMAGDIGFGRQPSYPNLGYSPDMSSWFANPGMGGGGLRLAPSLYGGGGIGSDAHYGGQQGNPYGAALDMLRAGQGWSIANTPSPASQGGLANRINQGIYDIGNAGDYYGRSIGGGFGMGMPNQGQGLTPQDLAIPHAYPPEVRAGYSQGSL